MNKTFSVDVFTDGGKDIVLAQYGATWKLHRRIAVKALRSVTCRHICVDTVVFLKNGTPK